MSFLCKKKKDSVYNDKLRGSKSSDALKPSRLPSASADSKKGTADDRPRSKHSDDGPTSTQRQSTQKGSQKGSLTPPPPSSRDAHRTSSSSSGYSYAMPAIATTASPRPDTRGSRSSSAAAEAAAGTDAFLVPPRSNTAPLVTTVTLPRHSPQARVQLPALNSAHSNRSSCDSTSPAPTVVSAPPSSSRPFSAATAQGSGDLAAMAPMPRHSASEPAQSPLMGLRRVSNSASVGRNGSGGHAGSPASPGKTPSTQAVVIAGGTTTPDAKRARAAADVAGAALTATAPTVNAVSSLSTDSPPAALFSAMELVPKKTGTSFRLQKRRSSSLQPDSAGGTEMGGGAAATGAKGTNSFRMSSSSNNNTSTSSIASATTADPTRKERQANGGGSSHGRRREPVAGFASDVVEPSPPQQQQQQQQRASLSTRSGSLNVPLPPPLSTENLAAHHGDKAAALSSRPASVHGGGAASQDGDDNIASVRRSRRSSMRLHAPPSAGSLRQSSISSTDDAPRPLTRHASTLSSGQKEALRKTPSFLSRVHTPPPSDMREIVQLRRVRRPPSRDANAAGSAAPGGADPKNEASMASDSTIQVSSVMGEKTTANGDESRRHGSMKKSDANASPASPPPPPSAASPSVRDATSVPSSVSSSFRSAQVRPAVRALRSMASSTTSDSRVGVPAATVISGGGANHGALSPISTSFSSFTSPPSTTRPSSARSSQQRQRHDPTQKGGPSLPSESPEPAAATAAAPTTPPPPAAAAGKRPDATRLGASSSQHVLATTSSDAVNIVASNASVFSSEAELFDYYGSFMLTAPQFNKSPARTAGSSPPPPAPSEDSVKRWGKPGKDAPRPLAVSGAEPKKVSSDVMSFVSETGSFSDVLELSPAPPTATKAPRVPPPIKPKLPSTPPPPPPAAAAGAAAVEAAAPSDAVRVVRPAGRHRQVNAYVDEDDENSIFQTAKDTSMHSVAYDYFMLESEGSLRADVAESKSPAAAQKAAAPVPAKRTAPSSSPAAAAAPSSAMNQLSSDDDDDDDEEEDEEALLQGFRPAAFDAAHDRRRGSTIVFYLGAEDSLSSLDVVVKASADTRWQSPAMLSPLSSTKRPRQADYSIVRSSSSVPTSALSGREMGSLASTQHAAAATEAVARPRVTLEPYVPLGSASSPTLHPSPDTNGAGSQSDATRRESSSLFQDSYGLQLDGSAPSLPASAAKMVRQSSLPHGAEKAAAGAAPASIFLGTTSRFAADPAKLHRPLANTFGYTNAQRQARAAAMAAGVSVEAWESSVGMDDVDDGGAEDEENEYKEVYTDENGDEWYWEEVEEEGEEEGEEEEVEEEEEGEQDDAGEAAVHKATASPQQHEGLRGGATAHPVGAQS